jgi:hypothetical protein
MFLLLQMDKSDIAECGSYVLRIGQFSVDVYRFFKIIKGFFKVPVAIMDQAEVLIYPRGIGIIPDTLIDPQGFVVIMKSPVEIIQLMVK